MRTYALFDNAATADDVLALMECVSLYAAHLSHSMLLSAHKIGNIDIVYGVDSTQQEAPSIYSQILAAVHQRHEHRHL